MADATPQFANGETRTAVAVLSTEFRLCREGSQARGQEIRERFDKLDTTLATMSQIVQENHDVARSTAAHLAATVADTATALASVQASAQASAQAAAQTAVQAAAQAAKRQTQWGNRAVVIGLWLTAASILIGGLGYLASAFWSPAAQLAAAALAAQGPM